MVSNVLATASHACSEAPDSQIQSDKGFYRSQQVPSSGIPGTNWKCGVL